MKLFFCSARALIRPSRALKIRPKVKNIFRGKSIPLMTACSALKSQFEFYRFPTVFL